MGSCSAKSWPVEGFPREKDSCMFLLSQCVCPGKTPPWSLTSTCTVIHLLEQGMEPWMEKVPSPRSPSWLAEPGLNACPTSASEGLFPGTPVALCHSAGWEVAVLRWGCSVEDTPCVEKNYCKVRSICQELHWRSEARTGGCQLDVRAGQPPRVGHRDPGSTHVPRCWDTSNLRLAVVEPKVILSSRSSPLLAHVSLPLPPDLVRWQHLSHLSLPTAVGGKPVLPPAWGH